MSPRQAVPRFRITAIELLERDNMYMAKVAGAEFVDMMAKVQCWPAAARMLDYLEGSSAFGDSPAVRSVVADAAMTIRATIERTAGPEPSPGRDLDDRHALTYMRDTLDQLTLTERTTD